MSMQSFYARLFPVSAQADHTLRALTRLTQATLKQIAALEAVPGWDGWTAEAV